VLSKVTADVAVAPYPLLHADGAGWQLGLCFQLDNRERRAIRPLPGGKELGAHSPSGRIRQKWFWLPHGRLAVGLRQYQLRPLF